MNDYMCHNCIRDRIKKKRPNQGFTLAEVLIVVGILSILLAVSIPAVIHYRKNLRQRELDEKAQIIYVAVQNQLAMLEAEGKFELYDPEINSELKPSITVSEGTDVTEIYYISHSLTTGNNWEPLSDSLAYALMYSSNIDGNADDALSGNSWIIELDPKSSTVYAVFYSEDGTVDLSNPAPFAEHRKDKATRIQKGANVGYYGGDTVGGNENAKIYLYPTINVFNEEVLYAQIQCINSNSNIQNSMCYEISISNTGDTSGAKEILIIPASAINHTTNKNEYTLVLDDLSAASTRFANMFDNLVPGKDIDISVSAFIDPKANIENMVVSRVASAQTNSLFADADHYGQVLSEEEYKKIQDNGDTAVIMYCRHLQNLDKNSKISEDITKAIQISDLDFKAEKPVGSDDKVRVTQFFKTCYSALDHNDNKHFSAQGIEIYRKDAPVKQYIKNGSKFFNGEVEIDGGEVSNFYAIDNDKLKEYTGAYVSYQDKTVAYHSISNLVVSNKSNAGLFSSGCTSLSKIHGVDLIDAAVFSENGSAGALAGELKVSQLEINGVRAYISAQGRSDKFNNKRTNETVWISAENAGGLIGVISSGSVKIENSFATSVVGEVKDNAANGVEAGARKSIISSSALIDTENAGGLIGKVSGGNVSIVHSYADNYLCGKKIGGLVGQTTATISVNESYAAGFAYGFQTAKSVTNPANYMAGLVGGPASMKNSYTVLSYLIDKDKAAGVVTEDLYQNYTYSTAKEGSSCSNTMYIIGSTDSTKDFAGSLAIEDKTATEMLSMLGSGYQTDTTDTIAYNLAGQSLITYSYPRLVDPFVTDKDGVATSEKLKSYMAHQNDWMDEFRPGSLVYFEEYGALTELINTFLTEKNKSVADHNYTEAEYLAVAAGTSAEKTYGFFGGNINALLDDRQVLGDGYAIAYRKTDDHPKDIPDKIEIEVSIDDFKSGTTKTLAQTIALKDTTDANYVAPFTVSADVVINNKLQNETFLIYPISVKMSATSLAAEKFYQKVSIKAINSISENPGDDTEAATSSTAYYCYNPHFAKTVVPMLDGKADIPAIPDKTEIAVRTPRHLNDLSRFHDIYADATSKAVFVQEMDIDYVLYDWTSGVTGHKYFLKDDESAATERIKVQLPIGDFSGEIQKAFAAEYDGLYHEVRNISISTDANGEYAGLFGVNKGTIANLFLPANYQENSANNQYIKIQKTIEKNVAANYGTLVASNDSTGTIKNCAAAGFTFGGTDGKIDAYDSSNVFAGGLVGRNNGIITGSSADNPVLKLNMNFSYDYLGGLVGYNTGFIDNCYALGTISTPSTRGGNAFIGGLSGYNSGVVGNSYCAVALVASGDNTKSFGLTSKNGTVYNSFYLDEGTFNYVNHQYPYSSDPDATAGEATVYTDLIKKASDANAVVSAANSKNHLNTLSSSGAYPYRGAVTDKSGAYIHYGEWQDDMVMGTLGILYWEKETNGRNNGYHFSYLGTVEGSNSESGEYSEEALSFVKGTSLCTSHDDGGVIAEYGYGFYVAKGFGDRVTLETKNISISDNVNHDVVNEDAQRSLQTQLVGYDVYPFSTRVTDDMSKEHIYLKANDCSANGEMLLTFKGADDTVTPVTYKYEISPFFANAMQYVSYKKADASEVFNDKEIKLEGSDYSVRDYSKEPGQSGNEYEIRSAEQLQFINYNYRARNCNQVVTDRNDDTYYRCFTYLMQASYTTKNTQTWDAALNHTKREWNQTHDLNADNIANWTPIAAAGTTSGRYNYDAVLYAWFGGSFDGQNYKIKNININSKAFTVGLFGVTAGADISNVIMYSDKNSIIQRATDNIDDHEGAYSLGGLIGVAYDYKNTATSEHAIKNCSIAGYSIQDNSKNRETLGEANVGGLMGVSSVDLNRCSAVVDIEINCLHGPTSISANYIRCGGMAGANNGQISDCYTGGSISVGTETFNEAFDASGNLIPDISSYTGLIPKDLNTHIFIGGVSACSFTVTYCNFENYNGSRNGIPVFNNCYTYMQLPTMGGSIRAISIIGSMGDRFGQGGEVPRFNNCYYLDRVADIGIDMPAYRITSKNGDKPRLTNTLMQGILSEMLFGKLEYCKTYYWDWQAKDYSSTYNGLTALTYKQMASRLNNLEGVDVIKPIKDPTAVPPIYTGESFTSFATALNNGNGQNRDRWGYVTIKEGNDTQIDGKYSFPGRNAALNGKNYPFPTVIKQKNLVYSSKDRTEYANVHYGAWPVDGMYWSSAKTTIDLFADMDLVSAPGPESTYGYAIASYILRDPRGTLTSATIDKNSFTINGVAGGDGIYADIVSASYDAGAKECTINVKALKSGSVTIAYGDVSFDLYITANGIDISLDPDPTTDGNVVTYIPGDVKKKLVLKAACGASATDISTVDSLEWSVATVDGSTGVTIDTNQPDPSVSPATEGYVTFMPDKDNTSWPIKIEAKLKYPLSDPSGTVYTSSAKYITFKCEKAIEFLYDSADASDVPKLQVASNVDLYSGSEPYAQVTITAIKLKELSDGSEYTYISGGDVITALSEFTCYDSSAAGTYKVEFIAPEVEDPSSGMTNTNVGKIKITDMSGNEITAVGLSYSYFEVHLTGTVKVKLSGGDECAVPFNY